MRRRGALVELTATEFDVLLCLVEAGGRVLSREQIQAKVWGPAHHGTPRTIDNFILQLRAKLEEDPAAPRAHRDGARRRLPLRGVIVRWGRTRPEAAALRPVPVPDSRKRRLPPPRGEIDMVAFAHERRGPVTGTGTGAGRRAQLGWGRLRL